MKVVLGLLLAVVSFGQVTSPGTPSPFPGVTSDGKGGIKLKGGITGNGLGTTRSALSLKEASNNNTAFNWYTSSTDGQVVMNVYAPVIEGRTKISFWDRPGANPHRPLSIEAHGLADPYDTTHKHVSFYTEDENGSNERHVIDWEWGDHFDSHIFIWMNTTDFGPPAAGSGRDTIINIKSPDQSAYVGIEADAGTTSFSLISDDGQDGVLQFGNEGVTGSAWKIRNTATAHDFTISDTTANIRRLNLVKNGGTTTWSQLSGTYDVVMAADSDLLFRLKAGSTLNKTRKIQILDKDGAATAEFGSYTSGSAFLNSTTVYFGPLGGGAATAFIDTSTGKGEFDGGVELRGTAPTVTSGRVGFGSGTSAATFCGSLAGAAGCLIINVAGANKYIPYY